MRDHVIIYVNGARHEVRGGRAFQSLSDFLRYDLGLVGTKVVCAEGDCGSCTILLGRADGQRLNYRSTCSCIQFLCQLDCTHIVTVEGLKYDGELNPVQEAMVACQGSQCGFCTPGFVVSICGMFEDRERAAASPKDVQKACVGNLCRCTGYESILKAGSSVDGAKMRPLAELYPPAPMLAEFEKHERESVLVKHGERMFSKPANVSDACQFRADNSTCTVISGGTDIGVQINKGMRDPKVILSLSALRDLRQIRVEENAIVAGAMVSISKLERVAREALPEYAKLLYWFGSPPIKNAGTVGGNIANGSPIGDSMPAMFVLDAEIELTGTGGARRVSINDFYTGYRKTVATADELITAVRIPLPASGDIFKLYKISRRKDLDISAFTAAIWMRRSGEKITDARIAYGGVGPVILRLKRTEEFFKGNALTPATIREAGEIARGEITPISDVRGSAEYRSQLGENVLRKFYADLCEANGNGNGHK
ncbi:MAG TPA: FAD binding domain-containing protein [Tepidisphaeraceae bacterium]|jgi:xanthine dehydrogenase small subunit|nr:FAD binding domain-containing protein [Tepidisphaeraceae bacterium]